jgi:hypothetical protein
MGYTIRNAYKKNKLPISYGLIRNVFFYFTILSKIIFRFCDTIDYVFFSTKFESNLN